MKVLYINDYACSKKDFDLCREGIYPKSHLWGMFDFINSHPDVKVKMLNIKSLGGDRLTKFGGLLRLYRSIIAFIKGYKYDVIYSALPGYELGFLLAKRLGLKNYKIISVVHHPASRLFFTNEYHRMIFISKTTFEKYSERENAEYLFWGPDMDFYNTHRITDSIKYDFIAAGKTYRDYPTMEQGLTKQGLHYKIFGNKNDSKNEIAYPDLIKWYCISRYICIPMKRIDPPNSVLIGLTSFVDALALGIPVLMSDNSLIGIDVERENIGRIYKVEDRQDFDKQVCSLINLSASQYKIMSENCIEFSKRNSFAKFSKRIEQLIYE